MTYAPAPGNAEESRISYLANFLPNLASILMVLSRMPVVIHVWLGMFDFMDGRYHGSGGRKLSPCDNGGSPRPRAHLLA